jgi:hypothetical protein
MTRFQEPKRGVNTRIWLESKGVVKYLFSGDGESIWLLQRVMIYDIRR